jgi:hypothetical protein
MQRFATAPHESLAHQKIARQISHERQLRRYDQIGTVFPHLLGATSDECGVPGYIAGRGINLQKGNPQEISVAETVSLGNSILYLNLF